MKLYSARKIFNGTNRRIFRFLKLHPTSYPYLSGDTFRKLAQHVHDIDSSIESDHIQAGDILFVQSPRLQEFFTEIHPKIKCPYILITHNGDENITEKYLPYLTNTIIHWFAQNSLIVHSKITPLPIGLENKWYHLHGIPSYFDKLRSQKIEKEFKILYKFNVATNPHERGLALTALKAHPLAETYTDWRESFSYLSTLQKNAFVASPPGNGEDCIRTWEAMYLGSIPILKRSALSEYFTSLGLPIVIIDNWTELADFNQEKLRALYATISPKFASPALWAEYWIELIKNKKHDQ
jgi:hypothetical protein